MSINWSILHEGDVFFTADKSPLSWIIRKFTNSPVSHVGQLIRPYSGSKLFYRVEMVQDWTKKQDLKITNPLNEKEIVSIKRPMYAYKTEDARFKFRHRMIQWHEKFTISYDMDELFSHIPWVGSKEDKDKTKKICSRLVYQNLIIDGCPIANPSFEKAVTPDDLYNSELLREVEGWKV
jgi:hypothetical protein